ncbi:hypothetical protein PF008_g21766 [Phytophthora fragariae]|uniref:Uncharacterized protein n=1 Tax=Phytophthora fragariae TaxID=53985 RepID=A0A6G0QVN1_9STRA|nr:hypothetical protein PF008_g21766 [Phytophthora fragariae]
MLRSSKSKLAKIISLLLFAYMPCAPCIEYEQTAWTYDVVSNTSVSDTNVPH